MEVTRHGSSHQIEEYCGRQYNIHSVIQDNVDGEDGPDEYEDGKWLRSWFDVPCGSLGDYLDPSTTNVRFKAAFTSAGAVSVDVSRL
jgi:hypothetical protein